MRDYKTEEALMHIDPFKKEEDYFKIGWVSEYDLVLYTFDHRVMHYDELIRGSRYLRYDPNDVRVSKEIFISEFRRRLYDEMQRKNITQDMMAEMVDTTQQMISRYIKGESLPSSYMMDLISNVLNCRAEDLTYKFYRLK